MVYILRGALAALIIGALGYVSIDCEDHSVLGILIRKIDCFQTPHELCFTCSWAMILEMDRHCTSIQMAYRPKAKLCP